MPPHVITTHLPILLGDTTPQAGIKGKLISGFQRVKAPFSGPAKWAKEGRLDQACSAWEAAYELYPESYALPYNLGVCAEVAGQLDKAQRLYEIADRNTHEPVGEINEALARMQTRRAQTRELAKQLPVRSRSRRPTDRALLQAQKRLAERGYDPGRPDGHSGPRTRRALRAFQSDHQISVTGRLDATTKTALGF